MKNFTKTNILNSLQKFFNYRMSGFLYRGEEEEGAFKWVTDLAAEWLGKGWAWGGLRRGALAPGAGFSGLHKADQSDATVPWT